MKKKGLLLFIIGVFIVGTTVSNLNAAKLLEDFLELIEKGELEQAGALCLNQKQEKAKKIMADMVAGEFLKIKELEGALGFYEIAENKKGISKVGDAYREAGNIDKALEAYLKGQTCIGLALAYEAKADGIHKGNNDDPQGKALYQKAVDTCEFLIKEFGHYWEASYFPIYSRCLQKRGAYPKSEQEKADETLLDKVMRNTAKYCDRLHDSAYHFFSRETIDIRFGSKDAWKPIYKQFVYEYQLIKENSKIEEYRIMKKQNGVKVDKPDAKLADWGYYYEKLIFGPLGLMGRSWFPYHHYKIVGREELFGETAVVIEALPKEYHRENHLFGKVWISLEDYGVMKIEYCPKSLKSYMEIMQRAVQKNAAPSVVFMAEYNAKKRGLRFPSRYYIEEGYINPKGKRWVNMKQEVKLDNYMFFTVGSEIIDSKGESAE